MSRRLEEFIKSAEADARQRMAMLDFRKGEMVSRHKDERGKLWAAHDNRWLAETNERAQRMPRGFSGIWHRLTGQYAKIKAQNEQETLKSWQRDREQKDEMIFTQLEEREALQRDIKRQRSISSQELMELRKEVANFLEVERPDPERSAIRKKQVIVFMVSPLAYSDELALLQNVHLQSFMMSLKEYPGGQPVEFILDEACNAKAALSNLIDDLTLVRGLSARVHLVAQAESQIVTTWGRDAAKTLDAVTDLKQIMGTNSPEEGKRPASLL
ncbi:TraM recognition site of TraD and TraG [Roseovarius gaetbuli]|uniref:TraM recognition site of TraD and TraG n=2 Tax=Roseovarius gaetbuli TaxID=1356575 RepID=A0A1X7AAL1_9RHOB|nr:TraM recognition site of TraD and TraG [Roseovarius gaetbuli]